MKFFLPLFLLMIPAAVSAAGIEVRPAELHVESGSTAELVVANPTSDVQIFEVYADDFDSLLDINPRSFMLEAGGRKIVTVQVSASEFDEGIMSTLISVVSSPLVDSRFQAKTGVKIPTTITAVEKATYFEFLKWLSLTTLLIGLFALLLHTVLRKKATRF